jgi:hypothetical protein
MPAELTADEVCELLDLAPHPTCGFVRVSYVAEEALAEGTLNAPLSTERPLGSALYFLVTPTHPVRLHRIRSSQLYHHYLGDPLEVFLLHGSREAERVVVGSDLRAGERPQLLIPGNTFHTARLIDGGSWFLGASTEWPGVIAEDVEPGDVEALSARFPRFAPEIRSIADL